MLQNKMALQQFAICAGGSIGFHLLRSQKRVKLPLTAENRCGQGLGRLKPGRDRARLRLAVSFVPK
jgi:hypothetical protein